MATGHGLGQVHTQVLSTIVTHKQETLQYLTVDNTTYYHWRVLARTLDLSTDCDVAAFLLQHYEKTSELQLTQCVKCNGPVVQYCVPCNIYMTQPTTASTLLQQEGATCEDPVMPGDTIIIDVEATSGSADLPDNQEVIMIKTDITEDMIGEEEREGPASSNQLEALVEACTLQGALTTPSPTTPTMSARSLLTPETLSRLKAQSLAESQVSDLQSKTDAGWSLDVFHGTGISGETPGAPHEAMAEGDVQTSVGHLADSCPADGGPMMMTSESPGNDLSGFIPDLTKHELSDDDSDYYCEPLFKPENANDKDLESVIKSVDKVLQHTASDSLSQTASLVDSALLKVTQSGSGELTLAQSSSADGLSRGDGQTVELVISDLDGNNVEVNQSGCSDIQSDQVDDNETDTSQVDNDDKAKSLDSPQNCARIDTHRTNTGEKTNSASQQNSVETHTSQTDSKDKTNSLPSPRKSVGRKRKAACLEVDKSPPISPKKPVVPAVAHTMRTRFFNQKRPSWVPSSTSDTVAEEEWTPSSSKKDDSSGAKKRGRPSTTSNTVTEEEWTPSTSKKEQTPGARKRGRKPGSGKKGNIVSKSKNNDSDRENEENIAADDIEDVGEKTGKMDSLEKKKDELLSPIPSAQNLHNQVIIITAQESMDKAANSLSNQPPVPASRVKLEIGDPIIKVETNIEPIKTEPPESFLDSKVSIVTDDKSLIPRKRRQYNYKKLGKTHVCDICEEVMGTRGELKRHMIQQHGNRPFACSKCPATYKCRSHLRIHQNRHAGVKPYKCPSCPKCFTSNYALNAHKITHSTVRPEVCDICGLTFKSAKYLKGHIRTHDPSDKPFICQECGARFSRKNNLNNHLKIHNNDKRFSCPHCDRKFIQSGSMKSHVFRMHNPNRARPYVCEVCGEARYAKDQFEKHMMIHTGTKPFKCEVCGAAFVQSNALKGHMKIHTETEGKSHWCSLCGAAFKKFASLKKHLSKVHQDYPDMSIATFEIIEVQVE